MKSLTLRDRDGKLILKVLHRKNGEYDAVLSMTTIEEGHTIEARDDKGRKTSFNKGGK